MNENVATVSFRGKQKIIEWIPAMQSNTNFSFIFEFSDEIWNTDNTGRFDMWRIDEEIFMLRWWD